MTESANSVYNSDVARMRLPDAALILAGIALTAGTVHEIRGVEAARRLDHTAAETFMRAVEHASGRYGQVYVRQLPETPGLRVYRVCVNHVPPSRSRADYRICALVERTAFASRVSGIRRVRPGTLMPPWVQAAPS